MLAIVGAVTGLKTFKGKKDDDKIDRLSNRYTVVLLISFTFVVMLRVAVSSSIICWTDKHFTKGWVTYTNNYCWVKNTYYLPFDEEIPREDEPKDYIPYYQWIPFILLGQALGFYFPSVVWHSWNCVAGVDADTVLTAAQSFNKLQDEEKRTTTLRRIRIQMDRFLINKKQALSSKEMQTLTLRERIRRRRFFELSSRRFGCYLILLYIFTKVLYLANVIAQLFMLNSVLAVEYSVYGIEVFRWMLTNYDWTTSPQIAFPRVTMCDFKVRRLGNVHRYTVQCTLPINLYNEKIYMFLWFWMVFVAICTAISLITWILRLAMPRDRTTYIQNHLRMLKKLEDDEDKEKADAFTKNYLRQDGVFLLRLIGHNTNTLTVSEIIGALWDHWNDRNSKRPTPNAPPALEMKPTTEEEPMLPEKEKEK